MRTLIVYAHPWDGSFNRSVLDTVVNAAKKVNNQVEIIDLYKDGFNPAMSEKDLQLYSQGKFVDPLVGDYQNKIMQAEHLVFIFPIWWSVQPAILKGFIDKVFLNGWAFEYKGMLPKGKIKHLKQTTVINTMGAPLFIYRYLMRAPIVKSFIDGSLKFSGIKNIKWLALGRIADISDTKRKKWLEMLENYFSKL